MRPVQANCESIDPDRTDRWHLPSPNLSDLTGDEAVSVNSAKLFLAVISTRKSPERRLDGSEYFWKHRLLVELVCFRIKPHSTMLTKRTGGHVQILDGNQAPANLSRKHS